MSPFADLLLAFLSALVLAGLLILASRLIDEDVKSRAARIKRDTDHDAQDPHCKYYAGDFGGMNFNAVCDYCAETKL